MWNKTPATTGINYFLQPQLVNPGFLLPSTVRLAYSTYFFGDAWQCWQRTLQVPGSTISAVKVPSTDLAAWGFWSKILVAFRRIKHKVVSFIGHVKWYASLFRSVTTRTGAREWGGKIHAHWCPMKISDETIPSRKGFEVHQVWLQLIGGWKRGRTILFCFHIGDPPRAGISCYIQGSICSMFAYFARYAWSQQGEIWGGQIVPGWNVFRSLTFKTGNLD